MMKVNLKFIAVSCVLLLLSFSVFAKTKIKTKPVKRLFSITKANGIALSMPSDVAAINNKIYIVDGENNRIVVTNAAGKYLFSFGKRGQGKGEFYYPVGIFVGKSGEIYVADTKNYRIQKFDRTGKHIKTIKIYTGKKNKKTAKPVDMLVNEKTKEIYVTTKNSKVVVYNSSGKKLREWGANGTQSGQFRFPGTIIGLSDSRVAVVDILNTRVQVFRNKGTYSFQVGTFGVRPGQFIRPKGVAVDKHKNFIVTDSYMDVIQVFSSKGKFLYVLGNKGVPHRFVSAAGIALDKNKLVVTEPFINKVSVYKLP